MNPIIAVVAQGAMGSGVGRRLAERGLRVVTSLEGRSAASAARAKEAGMEAVSDAETARADYFLSIVPPSEALATARKIAGLVGSHNHKPIYIDCNAVSPPTKRDIAAAVADCGAPFVDVGIIGGPPIPATGFSPVFAAAGPEAERATLLGDFGITVSVMDGPVGAAAALKMSYAGITKGTTALGSMMMLAAVRAGASDALRVELERSQGALLPWFQRQVPAMFSKAYRFVGEMEEIAEFVGEDEAARELYAAIAKFYTRLAADFDGEKAETGALADFLKPKA